MSFFALTLVLHLFFFPNESPQEVIDIFEGVRDDQALRMAANLGFKGVLERQVFPTYHHGGVKVDNNFVMLKGPIQHLGVLLYVRLWISS